MHPDRRIARLAAAQKSLVTIGQLRQLGLGRGAVLHRRQTGRLHRVHIGVYAVGHAALSTEAMLLAAVMTCGGDALLSHDHAAYLWGMLPPWLDEVDLRTIHVTTPPGSRRGRRRGIAVHRSPLRTDERARHRGVPVTTPARTLIDFASRSGLRSLERAVDRSITEGTLAVSELRDAAVEHGRRPGGATVRRLLRTAERYDTVTRSELEEEFLAIVRGAGLSKPALNARLEGFRVDAAWRRERVAVELDGYRWHRSRSRQESDRRREIRLRGAGWLALRYSARQVFEEPLAVVADVTMALAERRARHA